MSNVKVQAETLANTRMFSVSCCSALQNAAVLSHQNERLMPSVRGEQRVLLVYPAYGEPDGTRPRNL